MTQSTDIRPLLEQAAACIQILKQEWPDTPATVLLSAELALAQGLHPNDQRLEALNREKAQLEERLMQPLPPAEIAECGRRLKDCTEEVTALEEKWLDVSSALEELAR